MIVRAIQKYVRVTPRKLRDIADVVRGRSLPEINEILSTLNKRGARVVNETVRQAVANAVNNHQLNEQSLFLKSIMINEGPVYKRFRAGSRGRAKPYIKRTSHVLVVLEAKANEAVAAKKAEKPAVEAKTASQEVEASEMPKKAVETVKKAKSPAKTAKKPAVKKESKE